MPRNEIIIHNLNRPTSELDETPFPERYLKLAMDIGQKSYAFAATKLGAYIPLPGTHITERLRAQMPANQAKIGAQYVGIAARLKQQATEELERAERRRSPRQEWETAEALRKEAAAMKVVGHGTIANAILAAETAPFVPDTVTLQTVNIARKVHTHPELLVPPGWLSEFEAVRAEELLHIVPTRIL